VPGLDDVNPKDVSFTDDEAEETPSGDPDAQAQADEDQVAADPDSPLAEDDPNKRW
jgi:hypothetical protein